MKTIDGADNTVPNYDNSVGVGANQTRRTDGKDGKGIIENGPPLSVSGADGRRYGPGGIFDIKHYPDVPDTKKSAGATAALLEVMSDEKCGNMSVTLDTIMNELIKGESEAMANGADRAHQLRDEALTHALDKAGKIMRDGAEQFTVAMVTNVVKVTSQVGLAGYGARTSNASQKQGTIMAASQGADAVSSFGTSAGALMHAEWESKETRDDAKTQAASSGESEASGIYSDHRSAVRDIINKRVQASEDVERTNRSYVQS